MQFLVTIQRDKNMVIWSSRHGGSGGAGGFGNMDVDDILKVLDLETFLAEDLGQTEERRSRGSNLRIKMSFLKNI